MEQLKGDLVAYMNKTVSPRPVRHQTFVDKNGNRFEQSVVILMTAARGCYPSELVVDGDYWTCLPNPLFFALRGVDNSKNSFTWDQYAHVIKTK